MYVRQMRNQRVLKVEMVDINKMLRALKKFEQGIMVGVASLASFVILGYINEDQTRCQRKSLIENYEMRISKYEKDLQDLKDVVSELEKNKMK